MRLLYHFWLSPFSRKVRIVLLEKGLDCELRAERFWERRHEFLLLYPAGEVPVLVGDDGTTLADSQAICEYLEELYPEPAMLGSGPAARAETRRLVAWFDQKLSREVTRPLLRERLLKHYMRMGEPNTDAMRTARSNIRGHLDYIGWLAARRNYLAGEQFSLADTAAAAQLSCLDYLGEVPWEQAPDAKDWYARVKSRPSVRPLLADRMAGLPPPAHYVDLDF